MRPIDTTLAMHEIANRLGFPRLQEREACILGRELRKLLPWHCPSRRVVFFHEVGKEDELVKFDLILLALVEFSPRHTA